MATATAQLGKPYAHDFEPPPSEFYCSSLVIWSYTTAASGHRVFLPPTLPDFTLLFEPLAFWKQYYKGMGLRLPVNVTGSNPTLLLHSPALSFEEVGDGLASAALTASLAPALKSDDRTSLGISSTHPQPALCPPNARKPTHTTLGQPHKQSRSVTIRIPGQLLTSCL